MSTIAEILVRLGADTSDFDSRMNAVTGTLSGLSSAFTSAGAVLSAGITVPLVGLAAQAIATASNMESLRAGLVSITGSAAAGATEFARLQELAKLPGLNLEQAIRAFQQLKSAGLGVGEAERAIRDFGNALALVGKDATSLTPVLVQLAQMSNSTKVLAGDLKPIIAQIPQVASILREAFGTIDTSSIQKLGIGPQQMIETILQGLEKLPPAADLTKNKIENFKDAVTAAFDKIGTSMLPFVNGLLDKVAPAITAMADAWSGLNPYVQDAAIVFAAAAAAVGPLLLGFGALAFSVNSIIGLMTPLAGGFSAIQIAVNGITGAWGAVTSGIGSVVTALGGAVPAFAAFAAAIAALYIGYELYKHWDDVKKLMAALWADLVNDATEAWDGLKSYLSGLWGGISSEAEKIWGGVKSYFSGLWDDIPTGARGAWDGIKSYLSDVWNGIVSAARSVFAPIAEIISTVWNSVVESTRTIWNGISDFVQGVWHAITGFASSIWNSITEKVNAAIGALKNLLPGTTAALQQFATTGNSTATATTAAAQATTALHAANQNLTTATNAANAATAQHSTTLKGHKVDVDAAGVAHAGLKDKLQANIAPTQQLADAFAKMVLQQHKKDVDDYANSWLKLLDAEKKWEDIVKNGIPAPTINVDPNKYPVPGLDTTVNTPAPPKEGEDGTQDKADKLKETFDKIKDIVNGTFDKMADGMAQAITDGGSFLTIMGNVGSVLLDGLKDLGKGILDVAIHAAIDPLFDALKASVIEPLSKTLSGVIDSIVSPLAGKVTSALSGVIGKIGGGIASLGSSIGSGDIFDVAMGGVESATKVGGSAASGASSAISGVMGTIGAVGAAVSAVSGIIGNFQAARQENTLNAIEQNTRYGEIYLLTTLTEALMHWPKLDGMLDVLHDDLSPKLQDIRNDIHDSLLVYAKDISDRLLEIKYVIHDLIVGPPAPDTNNPPVPSDAVPDNPPSPPDTATIPEVPADTTTTANGTTVNIYGNVRGMDDVDYLAMQLTGAGVRA